MTVRCIECERYTFEAKEMAKHGFGGCKRETGRFPSPEFERKCDYFIPSPPERAAKGREFLEKTRKARQGVVDGLSK